MRAGEQEERMTATCALHLSRPSRTLSLPSKKPDPALANDPTLKKMASRRSMTARGSDQQDRRLAMPLSFTSSGDYPIGDDPVDLAVADLNGDGTPDIVTVNRHDGTLTFLRGNGDGTFSEDGDFTIGSFPNAVE